MINPNRIIREAKARYVVKKVITGDSPGCDFNYLFFSFTMKRRLRFLRDINQYNIICFQDHAHYMLELGYLNVFHKDKATGKKLYRWYESQMKHAMATWRIQLFCILYARSRALFEKYGESAQVQCNYFDIITKDYMDKEKEIDYQNLYEALSEYAELVIMIIRLWKSAASADGAIRTKPGFKEWLANEQAFIENIYILDSEIGIFACKQAEEKYYQSRKNMEMTIKEALVLVDKTSVGSGTPDGKQNAK